MNVQTRNAIQAVGATKVVRYVVRGGHIGAGVLTHPWYDDGRLLARFRSGLFPQAKTRS